MSEENIIVNISPQNGMEDIKKKVKVEKKKHNDAIDDAFLKET